MAVAGIGERTIEDRLDPGDLGEFAHSLEPRQEAAGGDHWPDGVRTRWADADLEDVEDADHGCSRAQRSSRTSTTVRRSCSIRLRPVVSENESIGVGMGTRCSSPQALRPEPRRCRDEHRVPVPADGSPPSPAMLPIGHGMPKRFASSASIPDSGAPAGALSTATGSASPTSPVASSPPTPTMTWRSGCSNSTAASSRC